MYIRYVIRKSSSRILVVSN